MKQSLSINPSGMMELKRYIHKIFILNFSHIILIQNWIIFLQSRGVHNKWNAVHCGSLCHINSPPLITPYTGTAQWEATTLAHTILISSSPFSGVEPEETFVNPGDHKCYIILHFLKHYNHPFLPPPITAFLICVQFLILQELFLRFRM